MIPDISTIVPNAVLLFIIVGVVQFLKSTGRIASADAPGASAVSGLVLGILLGIAGGHDLRQLIYDAIFGLALGLGATGGFAIAAKIGGSTTSGAFAARVSRRL